MLKVLAVIIAVIAVVFAGVASFSLAYTYADGERAGYVQKLSHRGWLCKTWEGEMAMVTQPGTLSEKFLFTVRDDAVAKVLNASVGKRVAIHYEQHKWIPNSCFGETEYFVTSAKPAKSPRRCPRRGPRRKAPRLDAGMVRRYFTPAIAAGSTASAAASPHPRSPRTRTRA